MRSLAALRLRPMQWLARDGPTRSPRCRKSPARDANPRDLALPLRARNWEAAFTSSVNPFHQIGETARPAMPVTLGKLGKNGPLGGSNRRRADCFPRGQLVQAQHTGSDCAMRVIQNPKSKIQNGGPPMFDSDLDRDVDGQRTLRREQTPRVRPRHGGRQRRKRKPLLAVPGMQNRRNKHWAW
jgi:hypothetical protein